MTSVEEAGAGIRKIIGFLCDDGCGLSRIGMSGKFTFLSDGSGVLEVSGIQDYSLEKILVHPDNRVEHVDLDGTHTITVETEAAAAAMLIAFAAELQKEYANKDEWAHL